MLVALIITGILVGLLSSYFGVGGGIIAVPALYSLFPQMTPQTVIGSCLGLICINSMLNLYNFKKVGKVPDLRVFIFISIPAAIGAVIGGNLALVLSPLVIKQIFAGITFIVALRVLFTKKSNAFDSDWKLDLTSQKMKVTLFLICLIGGLVSGVTGLGGGAVLVPLFITIIRIPLNWVPVYSNMAMVMATFAGCMSYVLSTPSHEIVYQIELFNKMQVGNVNFAIIFILFLGPLISSRYGVKLAQKVDPNVTKKLFAALLIIISTKIFIGIYL